MRKSVFRKWEHVVKSWFKWFSLSECGKYLFFEYVSFDESLGWQWTQRPNDGINCQETKMKTN